MKKDGGFCGPHEHHSNYLSWKRSLVEVVEIEMNKDGLLNLEELEEKLEYYKSRKRPILGSFSACSNVTGTCLDTRRIATLLHRYGGFWAICGDQDEIRETDGYDAIFLSPHKFLGGPGTPGILMMNKALYYLGSSPPSTCGGGTVDFVNCFTEENTIYVDDVEDRENAGTPPIIQKIKAALAIWEGVLALGLMLIIAQNRSQSLALEILCREGLSRSEAGMGEDQLSILSIKRRIRVHLVGLGIDCFMGNVS
uniref:Aminotransferase class V domain-containing protein n=1 Tax=Chenopodium quinoa TaxID=63459 RepID=A0A803NC97_CHEQI